MELADDTNEIMAEIEVTLIFNLRSLRRMFVDVRYNFNNCSTYIYICLQKISVFGRTHESSLVLTVFPEIVNVRWHYHASLNILLGAPTYK